MFGGLGAHVDTDYGGRLRTRKSTSCTMSFWGAHLVRSTATTQGIISLSSGEAEFYAATKGGAVGLGTVSLMSDMGQQMKK